MENQVTGTSKRVLLLNTFAFTVCFAAWMLNGVLVTFLVENQIFKWTPVQIGWLMGIPVLTGAVFRLPAGLLADRFGGKPVFGSLLFLSAVPMFLLSYADSYFAFALCSFGFGLTGASFAIGVAFTSVWFPAKWQGTALGIFGAGNLGAALTTLFAPSLLEKLTLNYMHPEGWRQLPIIYTAALIVTGILFLTFTTNKKPGGNKKNLARLLAPLQKVQVWRFGLYYFLVFGCFVAFSQWLVPYYVNVYYLPLITAGLLASAFSLPAGVIRAAGGWVSDRFGARKVMFVVLSLSVTVSALLIVPKMEIYSPGQGIMARQGGTVLLVSDSLIVVNDQRYPLLVKTGKLEDAEDKIMIFPAKEVWQEPVVKTGDTVKKKQLLAKGYTRIYFQATIWVFVGLVILIGIVWGIGSAAVYKFIPENYPEEVGVVGGMVGVLGGLGGFFSPIIFGYLLEGIGVWTSCWMFILLLSVICLLLLHRSSRSKQERVSPSLQTEQESKPVSNSIQSQVLSERIRVMQSKPISHSFENRTVAELVTEDYRKAEVFKKFGIDFCCGGKKSIATVCKDKRIDLQKLQKELLAVEQQATIPGDHNFQNWNIDFLTDYIVNEHHKYVRENIPLLLEFTQKVARVHGDRHPEVAEVAEIFYELSRELDQHIIKEEGIFFPYIKQLHAIAKSGEPFTTPSFRTAKNPIHIMENEHDHAGNLMKDLRELTSDFDPPPDACNTYRVSFFKLQEFEEDLHRHIHLENNILFPKTLELERRLAGLEEN